MQSNLQPNTVPRYFDFFEALPKTGSHRIKKAELVRKRVTSSAIDFADKRA